MYDIEEQLKKEIVILKENLSLKETQLARLQSERLGAKAAQSNHPAVETAKTTEKIDREQQRLALEQERKSHEEPNKDLDELIRYLKIAGFKDLARELNLMRYAFKKPSSDYIKDEISLRSREKEYSAERKTTKREYRDIKRSVIYLSKKSTHTAKKYKALYNLFIYAGDILRDMRKKGINLADTQTIKRYFTSEKLMWDASPRKNLGYELLEFYRNGSFKDETISHKL